MVKLYAQAIGTQLANPTTKAVFLSYNVGATIPVGAGHIMLSYGSTSKQQTLLANAYRRTAVAGYDYNLSKLTDVYTIIMHDQVSKLSNGTGIATGIRHQF